MGGLIHSETVVTLLFERSKAIVLTYDQPFGGNGTRVLVHRCAWWCWLPLDQALRGTSNKKRLEEVRRNIRPMSYETLKNRQITPGLAGLHGRKPTLILILPSWIMS
jgi:hypothetical protein